MKRHNNINRISCHVIAIMLLMLTLLSGCSSGKSDGNLNVYCFQAGKADAFLIYTDESAVLIDCGAKGFGKTIISYLEEHQIESLDYMIITHFDKDHVGGAAKIVKDFKVDKILQNDNEKDSKECDKYAAALEEQDITPEIIDNSDSVSFNLDGASYTVSAGASEYKKDDSNNASLITSVTYGSKRLLFTGDIQNKRIKDFIDKNRYTYDFLKVPHHGVLENKTEEFIDSVKPQYAVITSAASQEEIEDEEVISLLKGAGAEVFLTRESPVLVTTDGDTMTATYEN